MKMPKTTEEIVDWWDEGDNDNGHKDKIEWFSEQEIADIRRDIVLAKGCLEFKNYVCYNENCLNEYCPLNKKKGVLSFE